MRHNSVATVACTGMISLFIRWRVCRPYNDYVYVVCTVRKSDERSYNNVLGKAHSERGLGNEVSPPNTFQTALRQLGGSRVMRWSYEQ